MPNDAKSVIKQINWNAVAVASTILLAFVGYIVTHKNNIELEQRKAEIQYVNNQLEHLYGPLFSLNESGKAAMDALANKPSRDEPSTNPEDSSDWVLWMRTVFMPNNLKMEKVIIENAHLIEGSAMPPSFIDLLIHIQGYKVVLKRWEEGDYSELLSVNPFPTHIRDHIVKNFLLLKRRQAELIGRQ